MLTSKELHVGPRREKILMLQEKLTEEITRLSLENRELKARRGFIDVLWFMLAFCLGGFAVAFLFRHACN